MLSFLKRLLNKPAKSTNIKVTAVDKERAPSKEPTPAAKPAKPKYKNGNEKPPSTRQRAECDAVGLTIRPNMTSRDVWQMLNDAVKDPKYKALLDKHYAYDNALSEDDDRFEYGNVLIDELNKWEEICYPGQYLVTYKKGKILRSDIIEFERAELNESVQKPYVEIEASLPKIRKPRNEDPHLDWDKEITFKPKQILELKKLPQEIDMFDIDGYEQTLLEAKKTEAKYL